MRPLVVRRAKGRDGLLERGRVVAAHVQHVSEGDRLLDAGLRAELAREFREIRAGHAPRREPGLVDHFAHRAVREQVAIRDVTEAMQRSASSM